MLQPHHPRYRSIWLTLGVLATMHGLPCCGLAQQDRAQQYRASISNGILHVILDLPNPVSGAYRGTRFDWSGEIENLTYAGHEFYGHWFTQTDPAVHDFVFSENEIIAGPCSAITGPVEEFVSPEGAPGFAQAAAGGPFVKIGVGVLERPDGKKYDSFHLYKILDSGRWTTHIRKDSAEFRQKLINAETGYGYEYTKTIRLLPHSAEMIIEHTLKNIGRLSIETDVYDHNFLVLDHQPTGPAFTITLPFEIETQKPVNAALGAIAGRQILYRRNLEGREVFSMLPGGFDTSQTSPVAYDIRIENTAAGAGMRITADRPLVREELWSIRSTVAMEPYLHLSAAPGRSVHWSYHYSYYTLPR